MSSEFNKKLYLNIKRILKLKETLSGKYAIDTEDASRWVAAQKTPLKRQLAQLFLDKTVYVSFNDFLDGMEQLVLSLYKNNPELGGGGALYLYIGSKTKSFYFCAIIAMYFIEKHHLNRPTQFLEELNDKAFNMAIENGASILMFDDMAYSGSQLGDMLANISKKYGNRFTNLYVSIFGANTHSMEKIQGYADRSTKYKYVSNNFKITIHRKFDTILEGTGGEASGLLYYYFNPDACIKGAIEKTPYPYVSVYFDHKMADTPSTFMKTLLYGPVIPAAHSITNNTDELYRLVNSNYIENNRNAPKYLEYANKIGDVAPAAAADTMEFIPFIRNCGLNQKIIEDIHNSNMNYIEFHTFVEHYKEFVDFLKMYSEEEGYKVDRFFEKTHKQLISATLNQIDENRCIYPPYKNAAFFSTPISKTSRVSRRSKISRRSLPSMRRTRRSSRRSRVSSLTISEV